MDVPPKPTSLSVQPIKASKIPVSETLYIFNYTAIADSYLAGWRKQRERVKRKSWMGTLQTWRKAYGALKDHTTVGLARVNSDFKVPIHPFSFASKILGKTTLLLSNKDLFFRFLKTGCGCGDRQGYQSCRATAKRETPQKSVSLWIFLFPFSYSCGRIYSPFPLEFSEFSRIIGSLVICCGVWTVGNVVETSVYWSPRKYVLSKTAQSPLLMFPMGDLGLGNSDTEIDEALYILSLRGSKNCLV